MIEIMERPVADTVGFALQMLKGKQGESLPRSRLVLTAIDHFIATYQKAQPERR